MDREEDSRGFGPSSELIVDTGADLRRQLDRWNRRFSASASKRRRHDPNFDVVQAANEFVDFAEEDIYAAGWDFGQKRMRGAKELNAAYTDAIEPVLVHFHSYLLVASRFNFLASTKWRPSRKWGNVLDVVVELHAHALLVAEEVLSLLTSGFPQAAEARWRTLFELQIITRVIARGSDETARRYKVSHIVEQQMRIEKGDLDLLSESNGQQSAAYSSRVQKEFDRVVRSYGKSIAKPFGWAATEFPTGRVTFRRLAESVLRQDERGGLLRYANASHHIHGVRMASVKALQAGKSRSGPFFTPKAVNIFMPFYESIESLDQVTQSLAGLLHAVHDLTSPMYWSGFCGMIALDVQTEAIRADYSVTPSFLHQEFGVFRA